MSLINEALKRAQHDMAWHAAGEPAEAGRPAAVPPPLPPAPSADEPLVARMQANRSTSVVRPHRVTTALVALAVVAAAVAGIGVWVRYAEHGRPANAAVSAKGLSPFSSEKKGTVPLPGDSTRTDAVRGAKKGDSPLFSNDEKRGQSPETAAPPAPQPPTPAPVPAPVAAPVAEPAAAPQPPPAAAPQPAPRFRLSGIVRGSGGASAVINGQLLRVGDEIDGARIVQIKARSVELQAADGTTFSLRM